MIVPSKPPFTEDFPCVCHWKLGFPVFPCFSIGIFHWKIENWDFPCFSHWNDHVFSGISPVAVGIPSLESTPAMCAARRRNHFVRRGAGGGVELDSACRRIFRPIYGNVHQMIKKKSRKHIKSMEGRLWYINIVPINIWTIYIIIYILSYI